MDCFEKSIKNLPEVDNRIHRITDNYKPKRLNMKTKKVVSI